MSNECPTEPFSRGTFLMLLSIKTLFQYYAFVSHFVSIVLWIILEPIMQRCIRYSTYRELMVSEMFRGILVVGQPKSKIVEIR